ncbi:MAG: response regulator transcription factor [Albimonas sp.]|uniref:response regulator transcription factor n=1 Tax=Albimonas sp. TaxID=1872425 RepID=UPI004055CB41
MGSRPLISIVDDDDGVRLALRDMLASNGWSVADFASPEAFLADPASGTSACVISDLQMPGMDGLALHRALLARGEAPPLLLISAFASRVVHVQAARQGVQAVLEKPFEAEALLAAVARATGRA